MQIDFNKPVSELTKEESIYLGDRAKQSITVAGIDKPYVYQEYPKYLKELDITVKSEQEEKEAFKQDKEKKAQLAKYSEPVESVKDDENKSTKK